MKNSINIVNIMLLFISILNKFIFNKLNFNIYNLLSFFINICLTLLNILITPNLFATI